MNELKIQDIDHLGIVAGIIDEIGLVEIVNEEIGENEQEKVSAGLVVKAMVLNGLGFVTAPLYLFSQFFEGKAIEHLLGEEITAKDLNDDKLGRTLDKIYKVGVTQLFIRIALAAVKIFGVKTNRLHLDSSSISVEGEYGENEGEGAVKITHGYSRDKRPDLKQFMIDLICSGDGDVPIYFRVGNGNESDNAIFPIIIQEYQDKWQSEALFIADAALYSEENLKLLGNTRWLSRVPSKIKQASQLEQEISEEAFKDSKRVGYRLASVCSEYGGIRQRWLVVESEERKQADWKKLDKNLEKELDKALKELKNLEKMNSQRKKF
jgi:transposase